MPLNMKLILNVKSTLILLSGIFLMVVYGCKQPSQEELFLGEWEFVASYNVSTNEVLRRAEDAYPFFAIFDSTKITLTDKTNADNDDIYYWELSGDSLVVRSEENDNQYSLFIRTLNEKKFEVEIYFLGKTRLEFKRNN